MGDMIIQMAKPEIGKEEINAVLNVLMSGNLREGQICKQFEENFAELVGAKYATTVSNGTAALHTAYINLIRPGDEVLVPAFTFFATASMVVWAGGVPIFCDIDPKTFCLDLNDTERKITSKTRAIAPVHLFGNACDIDGIIALSQKHGLKIIWDAAQAHLTRYNDRDVGSYGDAVCYSFYATKNMTTGEGGMITSNDKSFIERCILLKHQGQVRKYHHTMMGGNYRMTDIQGAIGLGQLEKIERFTDKRRENAAKLDRGLEAVDGIQTPYIPPEVRCSYHQYTILLPGKVNRSEFIDALKEREIGSSVNYPGPLHQQPVFEKYARNDRLANAESISRRCLSLPVHPGLSDDEIQRIIDGVKEIALGF